MKEHFCLVLNILIVEAHGLDVDCIHIVGVCPHQITAGVHSECGIVCMRTAGVHSECGDCLYEDCRGTQ